MVEWPCRLRRVTGPLSLWRTSQATRPRCRSKPAGPVARHRLWRLAQFAAGALLVGLAARSIIINWQSLRAQPLEWRLSPGWIAASVVVVFAAYAVLIE